MKRSVWDNVEVEVPIDSRSQVKNRNVVYKLYTLRQL